MKKSEYFISELRGVPVYVVKKGEKLKKVGKVRSFIFHPQKRRVVGFTVKRPDVALVAHRSDLFVAIDSFDIEKGVIRVSEEKDSTGRAACKRMGVEWDECIMWQGLPLLTEEGTRVGRVGDVRFRSEDGTVLSLTIDKGASSDLLLGFTEVPAELILGFKLGVGDPLTAANEDGDDFLRGGIIVAPEVLGLESEGGLAQAAGSATAVVGDKAARAIDKAKPVAANVAHTAAEKAKPVAEGALSAAADAAEKAKPKAAQAAKATEEAINDGAYKLGKQLFKAKGMFSDFKDEYHKALNDGGEK